jgi:glyoxylase-like metal-dependent hydrolase (beta-lactamase superfamily II)
MKIGQYEIHPIETGRFGLDGGAMFGVVPKTLWQKSNAPDDQNRITMAARALLLVGDGRKVLIDTGNGSKFSDKLRSIYKIDTSGSDLISSLEEHNLSAEAITHVILTHLHFDHAGGSTRRHGDLLVPTFPNARYFVQRDHYESAMQPTERDRASFVRDDFHPLVEGGMVEFTDGEGEILPGIQMKLFHGHTTALQAPFISDGTTSLLFCADLIPLAAHISLPWIMAYDLRPLTTLEEKRKILDAASEEGWTLFLEHDPIHSAARVTRGKKGVVVESLFALE